MAQKDESKVLGISRESWRSFLGKYGISLIMVVIIIVIAIMRPVFLSGANLLNIVWQVTINGMLAFSLCLCITIGGIDLTVGAQLALGAVIMAQVTTIWGLPVMAGVVAAVFICTLFGFINGLFISLFNMFPFVVTLSMQLVIRGVAQVITGGKSQALSAAVKQIYYGRVLHIPIPIIIYVIVVILMYLMLHCMKIGRYILAVGGNQNAALASGVNVKGIKIFCYTLSGFLAGLAAIIMAAKTGTGQSNIGTGYETDAVAAAVIGGTSFAGGIATIPGVVIGTFIVQFIYNGINLIGIDSNWQSIIRGLIIIATVLFDNVINGRNRK